MVDIYQLLIVFVVVILTSLMAIIGVQVFFILKELRQMLKKTTDIVGDFETISSSVAEPISSLSEVLSGATGLLGIANWFLKKKEKPPKDE